MPWNSFMQLKMLGCFVLFWLGFVLCWCLVCFFFLLFQIFLIHYMIDRKSSLVLTRDGENCYQQILSLGLRT